MTEQYYYLEELKNKLNPHFVKTVGVDSKKKVKVYTLPARQLLFHPLRFDIMIKYMYIKYRERGIDIRFIKDLYALHLRHPDGKYFEEDGRKHSLTCYLDSFHETIDSISQHGFNPEISLVPVNKDRQILDGSHRVAASAYFGSDITVAEFDHSHNFSWKFFCDQRKLSQDFLDFVALHYCILNENSYIVNLRAIANIKDFDVIEILERYGNVYYKKEINISLTGSVLCEYIFYKSEKWIGSPDDNFSGAKTRANRFFKRNCPMRVIVFECPNLDQVKKAKQNLRDICNMGNDPVHITDTREETIELAKLFFNNNSLHLINNQQRYPNRNFRRLLQSFKHCLYKCNVNTDDVVIDGSSVMNIYGLRQSIDIDYLSKKEISVKNSDILFDKHDSELKYHLFSKQELIYDPRLHLYFDNIKFVSLLTLKKMKEKRGETPKDINDVKFINIILRNNYFYFTATLLKIHLRNLPHLTKSFLKKSVNISAPKDTTRRKILQKTNYYSSRAIKIIHSPKKMYYRLLPGYIHNTNYYGYKLFFSNKTSIVERYFATGSYEPEVINTIFSILDLSSDHNNILDIGANIGMISLAIAHRYPHSRIYAFEPGPHQANLLRQTIQTNGLTKQILLNQVALSEYCGETTFATHSDKHSSGDGLLDTGRCGTCQHIQIKTQTLDNWWRENKKPPIQLVKMDVEGAELLVMRGGINFFSNIRPPVIFEIHPKNLTPYNYSAHDLIIFFEKFGYEILNLNRSKLGGNQRAQILNGNYAGEFLAVPVKQDNPCRMTT